MKQEDIVIVSAARTPVGSFNGALASLPAEADEVARCVVFLAADEAAWITGSTLTINGGQFMD